MKCNVSPHNHSRITHEAGEVAWYVSKCFTFIGIIYLYEKYGWRETAFKVMAHTVGNFNSYVEDEHYDSSLDMHAEITRELEERGIEFRFRNDGMSVWLRESAYHAADLMISCLLLSLSDMYSWRDKSHSIGRELRDRTDAMIRAVLERTNEEREAMVKDYEDEYKRLGFPPIEVGVSTYGGVVKKEGYGKPKFEKPKPKVEKPKPKLEDAECKLFRGVILCNGKNAIT